MTNDTEDDDDAPRLILTEDEEKLWRQVVLAAIEHHPYDSGVLIADSVIRELRQRKPVPTLAEQLCRGCAHPRSKHDGHSTSRPKQCRHVSNHPDLRLGQALCNCTEFRP